MSPLLISSFLRNMWAKGGTPSVEVQVDNALSSTVKDDMRTPVGSSSLVSDVVRIECKGRQAQDNPPSVDTVAQVVANPEIVSNKIDIEAEIERLSGIKHQHDEAKAVKSDDAAVPIHLWDSFITRGKEVSPKLTGQLAAIRQAALQRYRRKLTQDYLRFLKDKHGMWYCEWERQRGDHKLHLDLAALREIVHRACHNTWFEYTVGSRVHYFRFPTKYVSVARDGVPIFFTSPGPESIQPQHSMRGAEREVLKKKVLSMWQKRYIDVPQGKLKSAIQYFAVPKGVLDGIAQDWRVVFYAGANGLNNCVWFPSFWLPSVESLLRIVDEHSFMEDRDVGEMFLNFELHPTVRKFAGVDVKPLGFTQEECSIRWLWWTKILMGFRASPYNSVKMYLSHSRGDYQRRPPRFLESILLAPY